MKLDIKFISKSKEVSKDISAFINKSVGKSLIVMERNVKAGMVKNWGLQTGTLKRSISHKMTGYGKGEIFTNPAGNPINYAVHVEYGTKHMAPRAFMRKGISVSKKQIQEIFRSEAKKVVDKRLK